MINDSTFIVQASGVLSKIATSAVIVLIIWVSYMGWMVYNGKKTEKRLAAIEKKLDFLHGFIASLNGRKK